MNKFFRRGKRDAMAGKSYLPPTNPRDAQDYRDGYWIGSNRHSWIIA